MSQLGEDCYFFYYSTCTKGDQCPFRHCAQALGSETVCTLWKEQRCFRPSCKYRHMDIKVNRSTTPCFWESQPGGCTKPHCVFLHTVRKERGLLTQKNRMNATPQPSATSTTVSGGEMITPGQRASTDSIEDTEPIATPQVAPLVVNPFDEESDADSSTSGSPVKTVTVKHLVKKKEPRPIIPEANITWAPAADRITIPRTYVSDQEKQANFGIKSLEDIRQEKLARAKEVLAEADELLTSSVDRELLPSHSIDELIEDMDEEVKESFRPRTSTRRIQLSSGSGRQVETADSTTPTTGLSSRRIIVVDADSSAEKSVASPKKVQPTLLSRLGGRAVEETEAQTTSDEAASVYSRLGQKRDINVSKKEEEKKPTPGIRSRLGLKRQAKTDLNEENDGPDASGPSRVKARLGASKSADTHSAKSSDSYSNISRLGERTSNGTRSSILSRLGQADPPSTGKADVKIKTWDEMRRDRGEPTGMRSSVEKEKRRDTEKRPLREAGHRSVKQEQKLYRPPAAKTEEARPILRVKSESLEDVRVRTRPEPVKRTKTEVSENVRAKLEPAKRSAGWGVKTFSEIMAEKRQRRLGLETKPAQDTSENNADSQPGVKSRLGVLSMKSSTKRNFSPISFSDESAEHQPQTKKTKKFTPIIFGSEELDSSEGRTRLARPAQVLHRGGGGDGADSTKKRTFSPISFDAAADQKSAGGDDFDSVTSSTDAQLEESPVQKSSLQSPPVQSPVGRSLPTPSPTTKSPVAKAPTVTSPVISTDGSTKGLTPLTANPVSRRTSTGAEGRRVSLTKIDTDDSFLNDVNDLLNDTDDIGEGTYDDMGDDDLLNEMEELLA